MKFLSFNISRRHAKDSPSDAGRQECKAVGDAVKSGDIGQTVTAVQALIMRYYENVRGQAEESFQSAKRVAGFGFVLLFLTVAYVIFADIKFRSANPSLAHNGGVGVGAIGIIASAVVEVVAGLQFVLYGRATRQFGAFHICLERTHRYLLAYEIAISIENRKDETLKRIVCIMANAPMITPEDIDGMTRSNNPRTRNSGGRKTAST